MTKIQVFTRWSRHGDMHDYANALEEWDDIVGDSWEEPEQLELDPNTWIADDPIFKTKMDRVREIVDAAYDKSQQFLQRFQPVLEIYWRNKQFNMEILVDEKLLNAVDSLSNTLKLFKFYQQNFQSNIPQATDIGLLHLNSREIKEYLVPTPKKIQ